MRCCMMSFAILLALIAFSPTQVMAKGGPGGGGGGGGGGHGGGEARGGGGGGGTQAGSSRVVGAHVGGDPHVGVSVDAGVNRTARANTGVSGVQGTNLHQGFDAHNRPAFSGGKGGRDSWRYRWDNDRWWFYGPDNRWMWYGDDNGWEYYDNEYVVRRPILETFSGSPIKIANPAKNGVTLSYVLDGNEFTIPPGYSQVLQADRAWVIQFSRGANLEEASYGLHSGLYRFTHTDHGWELYHSEFPQAAAPQPVREAPTNPSPQ